MNQDIELGRLLGRREAFSIVAGRCTAADAELLRRIRDEKLYLGHAKDWDEFCAVYLRMCRASANRLIALLNEFGPHYFEFAQLTRISPETYRAIAPSIQDGMLHSNGEAIALIPENAEKVSAAVAALRKPAAKPAVVEAPFPVSSLRAECKALIGKFAQAAAAGQDRLELRRAITELVEGLTRFSLALPLRE